MPLRGIRQVQSIAEKRTIAYTFAATNTEEVVLSPISGKRLAIVHLMATHAGTGKAVIQVSDENGLFIRQEVGSDDVAPLLDSAAGLVIKGSLSAEVSDTDVRLSVWAFEIDE
jgi:hypothetical protein